MDNESKRIGLYIGKDLLQACDNAILRTNITSRSEFISDAIEFYIAWLNSKNVSRVLTPALESVISSKILDTEGQDCKGSVQAGCRACYAYACCCGN